MNRAVVARLEGRVSEDELRAAVKAHLKDLGFRARRNGTHLVAVHPDGRRFVVEPKSDDGPLGPQQVTSFHGAIGELVQGMDDPGTTYALALPVNPQFRGLVVGLPRHARERLGLAVFWVERHAGELRVSLDVP